MDMYTYCVHCGLQLVTWCDVDRVVYDCKS